MTETVVPKPSLLPPNEGQKYGFFGYSGAMCDRAIRADNAPMLEECVERGFVDADSRMLGGGTVLEYCEKVAPMCAAMLKGRK
jgi:hypothetical protein